MARRERPLSDPERRDEKPEESGVGRSVGRSVSQSPSGAPPGKISSLSSLLSLHRSRSPTSFACGNPARETMKVGEERHIRSISK